jgi:hypothetical protein
VVDLDTFILAAEARPTWVLRNERSGTIRPLLHTSRNNSGCTDSVPWPTSEFEMTTPACTTSPGAISYFRRGVMHFRYIFVSVSSTDSKRLPALLQDGQHALGQVEVVQAAVAIRQHGAHLTTKVRSMRSSSLCSQVFTFRSSRLSAGLRAFARNRRTDLQLVGQLAARQRRDAIRTVYRLLR